MAHYMGSNKQVKNRRRETERTKEIIVFIGFMGSGKSVLGRQVAKRFGMRFTDLDLAIERVAGVGIPEIFRERGEQGFRELERQVFRCALERSGVIAAGGGLIQSDVSRKLLRQSQGRVFWLDVSWVALWGRLRRRGAAKQRPLLIDSRTAKPKSEAAVRALWQRRRKLYREAATRVVRIRAQEAQAQTIRRLVEIVSDEFRRPPRA